MPIPTVNSVVSALRFFFTHTLDRPDLARRLVRMKQMRKLPVVLSRDEVVRLLGATLFADGKEIWTCTGFAPVTYLIKPLWLRLVCRCWMKNSWFREECRRGAKLH